MDEQNNKIKDIVFFNSDGEYVYGDSQDSIDEPIAKMHDVVAKVTGDDKRLKNNERRHAKIGNNVILGSGCTIIGPVTIGDDCIIGARAIVTHDIPANSVVIGTNNIRTKRKDENAPAYSKE